MKIEELYKDYGIRYITEGHKHCRPGWVNTECPFCSGNPGWHLGYDTQNNYFSCWRCGPHSIVETIIKLTGVKFNKVKNIIKTYDGHIKKRRTKPIFRVKYKGFKQPSLVLPLHDTHKQYILSRNFKTKQLEFTWKIKGTGPISILDGINYSHRLFIPIYWDGVMVSFTTRDITGKAIEKYKSCPKNRETIEHKHILYGIQGGWRTDMGICVEGPTDVWRIGTESFATFGIKYTQQQVSAMTHYFKKIGILFDDDPQAQEQAKKLKKDLEFFGVQAINFRMKDNDPGALSDVEANKIKTLIFNKLSEL